MVAQIRHGIFFIYFFFKYLIKGALSSKFLFF
jgi:hypothetical protein